MKKHLLLMFLAVLCCIGIATAAEQHYDIVFKSGTGNSDASQTITDDITTFIQSGTEYVSALTKSSKVYKAKSGYGLKFGTGSEVGSMTLALSSDGTKKITKIVANACKYGSDNSTKLKINNINTSGNLETNFTDYTFTYSGETEVSSITIATSTKRAYIKSITVYYEDGASTLEDPQIIWTDYVYEGGTSIPRALTSYTGEVSDDIAYIIPYSKANYGQITDYTYEYSTPDIVEATENGLKLLKAGNTTVTAKFAGNDEYAAGSASINVTVTPKPVKPGTPVFSVTDEEVDAGTVVTVTSEGATSIWYTITYDDNEVEDVAEGDTWTFTVDKDCMVSVFGSNDAGDSETAEAMYTIINRLPAPTFSHESGKMLWMDRYRAYKPEGAAELHYKLEYKNEDGEYYVAVEKETADNEFGFQPQKDFRMTVYGIDADGVAGKEAVGEYTMRGPVAKITPEGGTYKAGTAIVFSTDEYKAINFAPNFDYEVYINGELWADAPTASQTATYYLDRDCTIEARIQACQGGGVKSPLSEEAVSATFVVEKVDPKIYWARDAEQPLTKIQLKKTDETQEYIPYSPYDGSFLLADNEAMTYSSSDESIVKVEKEYNENGYSYVILSALKRGVATITAHLAPYNQFQEATAELEVEVLDVPEKPVFSHEPGKILWLTQFDVTSEYADKLHYEIEYLDGEEPATEINTVNGNNHHIYGVQRDFRIKAYGINEQGEGETAEAEYTIRGPQLTTDGVSGEYVVGSRINFYSDFHTNQTYKIIVTPVNGEPYEYEHMWKYVIDSKIYYVVTEDAHIEVYDIPGSGPLGPESNHIELDIKVLPLPAPVPYVNDEVVTGPIPEGTEVTFKAEHGTHIVWYEYSITGDRLKDEISFVNDQEQTFTVDKMHRRFRVYNYNGYVPEGKKYSKYVDFIFELEGKPGKSYWKQIQSLDELSDGTRIVIGNENTYTENDVTNSISGVMSTVETNTSKNAWKYAECSFNKSDNKRWSIDDLPENARIITLEKADENQYRLKVDAGYLTASASTKTNLKTESDPTKAPAFKFAIADNSDLGKIVNISIPDEDRAIRTNGNRFAYYTNTYTPVIVFKEVVEAAEPIEYAMTLHHTTFTTGKDENTTTMARVKSSTDHDLHQNFVKNADGIHEATIENDLCGEFVLDIEGEEIGGHITSAKRDFHSDVEDVEGCTETEHAPYVYVGENADNIRLTHVANNANAVMLSTNPNEYHTQLEKHNANLSTLQVKLDPFRSATLAVSDQEGGVTGVENIVADANDADAIYYDLSGRRVYGKPVPGVYIEVRGTEATKVYLR